MNKEIFGLSGKEEILATLEAEVTEEEIHQGEDDMDMSGAGGPDDDR